MLKNIEKSAVLRLSEQIEYHSGQVVSKTLSQNKNVSLTLFSFAEGEEISTHASKGDAVVTVLDGEAEITIDDQLYHVSSGETLVMPANHPHALLARQPFKMLLTVVFPEAK